MNLTTSAPSVTLPAMAATLSYVHDDGGRAAAGYVGSTGDCVVRAIVIATGFPYQEVYDSLKTLAKRERRGKRKGKPSSVRDGCHKVTYSRYLRSLGWVWTPTMTIGSGCKVHLHDGELPMGRLVVRVSKHLCAVIDGEIRDTHDPRRETFPFRIFPGWETAVLKPGETRNENGVFTTSRRCVYGYWQAAEGASW